MDGKTLVTLAQSLLEQCAKKKLMLATAESCTGGLVAMLLTEIAGSSAVYERGFITYSNKSKTESLGVDAALISVHGAVSKEVASAMAKGAIVHSEADLSVAITGVAGPEGSEHKPVGLVYIGIAARTMPDAVVKEHRFEGNRSEVRAQAAHAAMQALVAASAGLEVS